MEKLVERFLNYIKMDTMSDPKSDTTPSSEKQLELGKLLLSELREMGLQSKMDEKGYVYGKLESNTDKEAPTIGFIAHMDTSPALDGQCVNPQIVKYQGGDIELNKEFSMTVSEFPVLKDLVGKTLITTDGTTLLGADNKAGIAEIMDAIEYLIAHPEIKHGAIMVGFTPDEEIGRGADYFDVASFGADFAYTVDGGPVGELEYENFNAASAVVKIQGKSVHPGTAKNTMINASTVGMELNSLLPQEQKPEYTQDYEGFIMLNEFQGTVDFATMEYIIRDHDLDKFEIKKQRMREAVSFINKKYGPIAQLEMSDSYYNMKEKIEPHMEIIELAKKSMLDFGITPLIKPIRGGTDGARLSYMGLPCPNIFTGGYNYHGRFEMIPIEDMRLASQLIVKIAENALSHS